MMYGRKSFLGRSVGLQAFIVVLFCSGLQVNASNPPVKTSVYQAVTQIHRSMHQVVLQVHAWETSHYVEAGLALLTIPFDMAANDQDIANTQNPEEKNEQDAALLHLTSGIVSILNKAFFLYNNITAQKVAEKGNRTPFKKDAWLAWRGCSATFSNALSMQRLGWVLGIVLFRLLRPSRSGITGLLLRWCLQ